MGNCGNIYRQAILDMTESQVFVVTDYFQIALNGNAQVKLNSSAIKGFQMCIL